jgi:hypothetical protein
MGNKYIYNRHTAPITANARDKKGGVLFTKKFLPERIDSMTGRVASTGYTTLTEEEYKQLNEGSKTFTVYRDKHKLLVEYDELPPELMTPQEALVDAKNEAREAVIKAEALEASLAEVTKERDALKKECEALKAGDAASGKGGKGKGPS